MLKIQDISLAVIGLGYVGLPLAIEFGKVRKITGFDINSNKINLLKKKIDDTQQISKNDFKLSKYLDFTSNIDEIKKCNVYIIAVPTPVDQDNLPDLNILKKATSLIGSVLSKKDIVIFESTVYPGTTEDICVPILEKYSNLIYNKSFYCGYSPERINPGDNEHTLTNITKVVSGSTKNTTRLINQLYSEIIEAGTYVAKSIKIAEASKIIENAQRDINIAFINELSMIFSKLNIDTLDVLDAAATKWNFLKFKPGLVGGHCIGVDPYYLAFKAKEIGIDPQIILSGRKVNDNMSNFVVSRVLHYLGFQENKTESINILLMGLTFKENCLDLRNSKSKEIFNILTKKGINIDIHDPSALPSEIEFEYKQPCINIKSNNKMYNAIIMAVSHEHYKNIKIETYKSLLKDDGFIFDVKGIFKRSEIVKRL